MTLRQMLIDNWKGESMESVMACAMRMRIAAVQSECPSDYMHSVGRMATVACAKYRAESR